jgi:hypothetical protein
MPTLKLKKGEIKVPKSLVIRMADRFIFPVGTGVQGYVNLKGYKEFGAVNRPEGWNVWLTLAFSPAPPKP